MDKSSIIILCPYPYGEAPSQRFRFEQFLEAYPQDIPVRSFYSKKGMKTLYGHNLLKKVIVLIGLFIARFGHIFYALKFDRVYIHRELLPIGPPLFEGFLKFCGKEIIYDFDDAIWLSNVSDVNRRFDFLKAYWKVRYIVKWASKVTVGNSYLAEYAQQYNGNVQIIPSTVDMENQHKGTIQFSNKEKLIIGWTGSHTTAAKYLKLFTPVYENLCKEFDLEWHIISNQDPEINLPGVCFIPWNEASEIADLLKFDIGIMPLLGEDWERGKCSFKAIQYMALGIPTVLSPFGNNLQVVEDSLEGLYAANESQWEAQVKSLLQSVSLREKIGLNGQQKIRNNYSLKSQEEFYLKIFTSV